MAEPPVPLSQDAPLSRGLFGAQLRRELKILLSAPADVVNPLMFFFLGITLFALGLQGERELLAEIAPIVIWVLVLLANLLSLENLYRRDYEDGSLEQLLMLARPTYLAVLGKVTAHWLLSGLWLCLLAPLAGLLLFVPLESALLLAATLVLGTPTLSLLGSIGAALTVGLGRSGVLLALLILPLYVPVLIFGAGAAVEHMDGIRNMAQLYWLGAIAMISLVIAPFATSAALQIATEQ